GCVFTKNATEAINLVAWAWGVRNLQAGDEIVVTEMEHHSNIVPWQLAAEITGAVVRFAAVSDEGLLDLDDLGRLITDRTRIVAAVHTSNVLGTINPVARIAEMAHAAGTYCLIDATQSVPYMPVDFQALGVDFLAATGHKMVGPTGIGILAAKPEILEEMEPFLGGGEMISDVRKDGSDWNHIPHKFEAGTPPIAEAVGLAAACDYLAEIGMDRIRAHEQELAGHMLDALSDVPDITIFGPPDPEVRGAIVSFALPDIHPHDLAQLVDRHGVAIRAGHHCAKPLMRRLGVPATARASGHIYNSSEDIDILVEAIGAARQYLNP
ncbi:MAG: cysteine desulfurase, partial [Thermoleophilia bacterium]|nr:cysteine desulfurase [Thermoleophilia bacterium]